MGRWRGAVLGLGAALLAAGPMTAEAQHPDSVRLSIVAPDSVRPGEPVPITLRLTNTATHGVEVHLSGRTVTFDIIAARPDGEVVWRRLARASGQQILQIKMLAPGETFELKDVWNQRTTTGTRVPAGDYTLQGILPTDGEPLRTERVRLRITAS